MHNMHIIEDNLFQVTFSLTTWSLLSLAKLLPYGIEMIVQHLCQCFLCQCNSEPPQKLYFIGLGYQTQASTPLPFIFGTGDVIWTCKQIISE